LPQGDAAVAARPVAGQVEHQAAAAVVCAHAESRQLVGAHHVHHRHRGLDGDPGDERGIGGHRVQVPVERLVPHQLRKRARVGEHRVDELKPRGRDRW
jgi:hypothetical protein